MVPGISLITGVQPEFMDNATQGATRVNITSGPPGTPFVVPISWEGGQSSANSFTVTNGTITSALFAKNEGQGDLFICFGPVNCQANIPPAYRRSPQISP
jgi:hypothetical protein